MVNVKRTIFVSLLLFLTGLAVSLTFLSFIGSTEASVSAQLQPVHNELVQVENKIAEIKPMCLELDELRARRAELVEETNTIINGGEIPIVAKNATVDFQ